MARNSRSATFLFVVLAGGLLTGCMALQPTDEVKTQPTPAAATATPAAANPTTAGPAPASPAPADSAKQATPPTGNAPASKWFGDPERPSPPPADIVGIAVDAIVTEPAVRYVTPADSEIPAGLAPTEMPTPKRPRPRATAAIDPDRIAAESAPQGELADGQQAPGGNKLGVPTTTPAFLSTFGSLIFDDNVANIGGAFIPPDSSGAAGPDHVVSVTNVSIQIHGKDGAVGLGATGTSLMAFFAPLAPVNPTFDPKVLYDQHAERFVVITLERQDLMLGDPADTSRILVAVSGTSDPTAGTWHMTAIPSALTFFNSTLLLSTGHWADYPGFGVDEEAVYITSNMFSFLTSGAGAAVFGGTRLWVIDKVAGAGGGLYGGGTATVALFDPYGASTDCLTVAPFCGTTQPAHVYGTAATTPNVGTWLSYFSGLTAFSSEFMQVMRLDDPIGPGTPTFLGPSYVSMGDIDDLGGVPLPDAPQMGTAETIETNDRRTLDSVWSDDSLYVTTTIDPEVGDPNDGEATAHWVHMGTSVLSGSPPPVALIDQGDIGGEDIAVGTHTFFPSIAVNTGGDVAIGFSASAPTIFPSSAYATRAEDDAAGTNRGSVLLGTGAAFYIRTFDDIATPPCAIPPAENRWGDYSATVVDPVDQCFWVYNEHALAVGLPTGGGCNGRPPMEDGRWGTTFGRSCICSETLALTTGAWKQISMTCDQTDGNRTLGDVFGDDLDGTYETDWIVKEVDPVSGINITKALTDPLEVGKGYWIRSDMPAQTVENHGIDNVETETTLAGDITDGTGCGTSAGLCNLVGHPHRYDVCWADVEVIDGASTLSLAMADPAGACQAAGASAAGCIMSRVAYKWTGAAYAPFDGITPGMEGTLVEWDGFWVSAVKSGVKLKIPATPGGPGLPCGPPAREGGGWFVRLIAETAELEDSANVLGQLPDSVDGYDSHDLLDLFPLSPYLTVAFPHPEWGDHANDYTSDFHLLRDESEGDAWSFEVRSSDPAATVTLRWEGPESRLAGSTLVDVETGEEVAVAPDGSYTFTMTSSTRSFQWNYLTGSDVIFADSFESGDTGAW